MAEVAWLPPWAAIRVAEARVSRLDHPVDHPDDPTGPVWSRLDRRGLQREQARSVWSRPDRRRAPGYGSGGWSCAHPSCTDDGLEAFRREAVGRDHGRVFDDAGAGGDLESDRRDHRPPDVYSHAVRVVDLNPPVVALDGDLPDREVGCNEGLAVEVVDEASAFLGSELAQPRPTIDLIGHLEGGGTPHGLA